MTSIHLLVDWSSSEFYNSCVSFTHDSWECSRALWAELRRAFGCSSCSVIDKWGHTVSQTEKMCNERDVFFPPEWLAGFVIQQVVGWQERTDRGPNLTVPPTSDNGKRIPSICFCVRRWLSYMVSGSRTRSDEDHTRYISTSYLHVSLCLSCVRRWTFFTLSDSCLTTDSTLETFSLGNW